MWLNGNKHHSPLKLHTLPPPYTHKHTAFTTSHLTQTVGGRAQAAPASLKDLPPKSAAARDPALLFFNDFPLASCRLSFKASSPAALSSAAEMGRQDVCVLSTCLRV